MKAEKAHLLDPETESDQKKAARGLSPGTFVQVFSALLYGCTAVAMNFVNKAALAQFPLTNVLLLIQLLLALLVIPTLKSFGYVSYPNVTRKQAMTLLPVTILYVTNVAFALISLSTLNIVFYSTLKRLTPMIVLVIKASIRRRFPERGIMLSVGLVVGGCIIAGIGDFEFNLRGYVYALVSCCLQASYLLLVEHSGDARGIGTSELMVYNALWAVPGMCGLGQKAVQLAIAIIPEASAATSSTSSNNCVPPSYSSHASKKQVILLSGEANQVRPQLLAGAQRVGPALFGVMLLGCGLFGMLLNFSQFLCTMHNSALTTTVVGVLKGVAATSLGFVFFGGVRTGLLNLTGILMNTAGGVWYGIVKYEAQGEKP